MNYQNKLPRLGTNRIPDHARVAIYTRVSCIDKWRGADVDGYSNDAQIDLLKRYCSIRDWTPVAVYSDLGISGKDIIHRPQMQQMLADAEKRSFDIVLVWKLSRLARNTLDVLQICARLEQNNIYLVSVSEAFDCTTSHGRMLRDVISAINSFLLETTSDNVRMSIYYRATTGARTCSRILGYDNTSHSTMDINPNEAEIVRFIYCEYLRRKNLIEVSQGCRERGYRGKNGGDLKAWSVQCILTRPIYAGYNTWRGEIIAKGNHPAIISVPTYNRVQHILRMQGNIYGRPRINPQQYIKNEPR